MPLYDYEDIITYANMYYNSVGKYPTSIKVTRTELIRLIKGMEKCRRLENSGYPTNLVVIIGGDSIKIELMEELSNAII